MRQAKDVSQAESHKEPGKAVESRLYMQLLAFGRCASLDSIIKLLSKADVEGVLYKDLNDPLGIALVIASQDPDYFIGDLRAILAEEPFIDLAFKAEYTMFGRTYALGHEKDLATTLIHRPYRRLLDPALPWAIWYPLRRSGSFEQLSAQEQQVILKEHGGVGRAFGRSGDGYDIRLACHGLDKHDNDFVIGLVGPQLYPLSLIVQRMRKTKQTSLHLERLGPFFIGRAVWKSEIID